MKTVIVYYSLEGNTEMTAKAIAAELGAELLPLIPVKAYPTGKVSKFVWGSCKPVILGHRLVFIEGKSEGTGIHHCTPVPSYDYLNRCGMNCFRPRRQVSHSWAVPVDS